MIGPRVGELLDELVASMQARSETVERWLIREAAAGDMPKLREWIARGYLRGELVAWGVHAEWLVLPRLERTIIRTLAENAREFAVQMQARAVAVYGSQRGPDPKAYVNLLADVVARQSWTAGAEQAGEAGGARFKQWIRAYPSKRRRDWHDLLNGVSIPIAASFVLPGGPNRNASVDGPHDWARLPDPGEWINCGHAVIYLEQASAESVKKGLRMIAAKAKSK